jgi:hypothetical protein
MSQISRQQKSIIVNLIGHGSFPHIAAEAAGVPRRVFEEWMEAGAKQHRGRQRDFWREVSQATARIRAFIETQVKTTDPKFWLRFGPGKQGGTMLGWGPPTKRRPGKSQSKDDWQPEFFALLGEIAQRLQDMPEARLVILDVIRRHQRRQGEPGAPLGEPGA